MNELITEQKKILKDKILCLAPRVLKGVKWTPVVGQVTGVNCI